VTIGTKSVLFGAHQFAIHPWFVAAAWWRLYGFPWDPRLWVAFFVHDLGYVGKPNMDGPEGETHAELGARVMAFLFDGYAKHGRLGWRLTGGAHLGSAVLQPWGSFSLLHSRYYSKRVGRPFSRLCVADKLAVALTPAWLYLPMVRLTGEAREYMTRESRQQSKHWTPEPNDLARWFANVRVWCARWAYEHRDCREDTWTPAATSEGGM
jgi:hypothetical protein